MNKQFLTKAVNNYKLTRAQHNWAVAALIFSAFDFLIQLTSLPGSFGPHPLDLYTFGLAVKRGDSITEIFLALAIVVGSAATLSQRAYGPLLAKFAAWISLIPATLQCFLTLYLCNDTATYAAAKKYVPAFFNNSEAYAAAKKYLPDLFAGQPDYIVTAILQELPTIVRDFEIIVLVCYVFQMAYLIGVALTMSKVYSDMLAILEPGE